jgi:hypothetical protein
MRPRLSAVNGGSIHANAFEPMAPGDPFGEMMNGPAKYVVSKTLEKPIWRNTTIIRDNVGDAIRKLEASTGKTILTDGSHQLVHTLLEHDRVDGLHVLLYPISERMHEQERPGPPSRGCRVAHAPCRLAPGAMPPRGRARRARSGRGSAAAWGGRFRARRVWVGEPV